MATNKPRRPLLPAESEEAKQHYIESGKSPAPARPRAMVRVPINFQAVGDHEAAMVERLKVMAFEQNRPLRTLWMEALEEYLAKREDR